MNAVFVAFYRGRAQRRLSLARLADWLTRTFTRGQYSHCEIAVKMENRRYDALYRCWSSSFRDGGVRGKDMALPSDKWDLVPVDLDLVRVMAFADRHVGKPYDWRGALGLVFHNRARSGRWFCSEYCAACLCFSEAWRISPSLLHALLASPAWISHQGHQPRASWNAPSF